MKIQVKDILAQKWSSITIFGMHSGGMRSGKMAGWCNGGTDYRHLVGTLVGQSIVQN